MNDDEMKTLLKGLPEVAMAPELLRNLREIPLRQARAREGWVWGGSWKWALSGLSLSLALGAYLGERAARASEAEQELLAYADPSWLGAESDWEIVE